MENLVGPEFWRRCRFGETSGAAGTDLVVEDYGDGVARRQEGVVEEVVVAEAWAAVDAH